MPKDTSTHGRNQTLSTCAFDTNLDHSPENDAETPLQIYIMGL